VIGVLPVACRRCTGWPAGLGHFHRADRPALVIALVSSLEMAASAKIESQRDGKRWNANQDLVGQGLGKLARRSRQLPDQHFVLALGITLYAGAKTGWARCLQPASCWRCSVLTPLLSHVPRAVLAAVVVAAVASLFKPKTFLRLARIDRIEAAIALSPSRHHPVGAAHLLGRADRGGAGLAQSAHRLHPRIVEVGLHADGSLRDRYSGSCRRCAQTYALRMDAELDFASASALERPWSSTWHPPRRAACVPVPHPVNRIDATGSRSSCSCATCWWSVDTLHITG